MAPDRTSTPRPSTSSEGAGKVSGKRAPHKQTARDGRVRAVIACERCKARRMRCDGAVVCAPCEKAGQQCVYQGSSRRVWVSQTTFLELERDKSLYQTKCKELERRVQELELASGLVGSESPAIDSASTTDATPASENGTIAASSGTLGVSAQSQPSPKRSPAARVDGVVDGVPTAPKLMTDPQGRARYLGECSGASFHDHLWEALYRALPMNLTLPAMPMHSYHTSDSRPILVTTTDPLVLPPRHLAERYVAAFLTACSEPFFWMTTETIYTIVDRLYRREPGSDERWTFCLFYLVLALGAQHSTANASAAELTASSSPGTSSGDVMPGMEYFTKAKLFLFNFCEESSVICVQCLALTALYLLSAHRRDAAYSYVGLAIRTCIALGLHRNLPHPTLLEHDLALEERRRLFWSVFCLDRIVCLALGRATQVSADEIRIELPSDTPGLVPAGGLKRMVVLCKIAGAILQDLYVPMASSTDTFSVSAALDIVERLEQCSFASTPDGADESVGPRAALMPDLFKNLLINIASRPVFLHIIGGTAVAFATDVADEQHAALIRELQQRCVDAAQATLLGLDMLLATASVVHWSFFDLHFSYNAAVTLTLAQAFDPSPSDQNHAPTSPATARTILESMSSRGNESAASCASIVSALELVALQLRSDKDGQAPHAAAGAVFAAGCQDPTAMHQELIDVFQATVQTLEREQTWLAALGPASSAPFGGTGMQAESASYGNSMLPMPFQREVAFPTNGFNPTHPHMQYFSEDPPQQQQHLQSGGQRSTGPPGGVDSFFTFI